MAQPEVMGRINYLDHLRAALVVLVVLHHVALVYGALTPFYYQEPPFDEPLAFLGFAVFVLVNQAWFMGALFFIAGFFAPMSFDAKGAGGFVKARLVRLGVPVLAGVFVLEPVARIGFFLMPGELTGISTPLSLSAYPKMIGLGPLWFIAMLLVFDLVYAAWRGLRGRAELATKMPGGAAIAGYAAALALSHYLWRMIVPLGQDVTVVTTALRFPTLAYLPEYFSLFVLGAMASRGAWLRGSLRSFGWAGLIAALAATAVLLPWALSGRPFDLQFAAGGEFTGGGTLESGLYAIWDALVATGLLLAVLALFKGKANGTSRFGRFAARQSYAVYLIHSIVIVFVAYALRGVELSAFSKFALVAAIVLPVAFGMSWIILRFKWVRAVI